LKKTFQNLVVRFFDIVKNNSLNKKKLKNLKSDCERKCAKRPFFVMKNTPLHGDLP
jgi:hypothetical protein